MSTGSSSPPVDVSKLPHDNIQPNIIACAVLTWVIAAVFVGLRFYTRAFVIRVLGWTDWCILAALVCSVGVTVSSIEQVHAGIGLHAWDFDINEVIPLGKGGWYTLIWYSLSLCFSKISILLLYLAIFSYHWVRIAGKVILAVVLVSHAWILGVVFTACIPLDAYWDWTLRDSAWCQPQPSWWANIGLHIATDFLIFLLPMPVITTLRLPRRQKYVLIGVFTLGFFVCLVSILRLINIVEGEKHPALDYSYAGATLLFWTSVEVNTAIVCACTMTLKPLIGRWLPKFMSTQYNRSYQRRDGYQSDGMGPPLTVGSRPSRYPLREIHHDRDDSWVHYPGKVDGIAFVADDVKIDLDADKPLQDIRTDDLTSRKPDITTTIGDDMPRPHLQPPEPSRTRSSTINAAGAFFDRQFDRRAKSPTESELELRHASKRPGSYDAASDKTDWGPERPASIGQEHKWN